MSDSAKLLSKARAKLAAAKKATPAAVTLLIDTTVQHFELTHLKTIKCDICQQKNGHILYKCQDCAFQHQICSRCIETTDPAPAEGGARRKDWTVHARLKKAHAAYIQPVCPGKKEDGSYERHGVKFVVLQGKRSGLKKPKKQAAKKETTATDRCAAIARGIGPHKTTEQGRRIAEMARARVERGQSEELRERVAAAKARLVSKDEIKDQPEGQDLVLSKNRKRKAAVLEDKDVNENEDKNQGAQDKGDGKTDDEENDDTTQIDVDDRGDAGDADNRDDGWDEVETAAAVEASMRDIACE